MTLSPLNFGHFATALAAVFIAAILSGCAHKSVASFHAEKFDSRSAIIFVPGYYGSALEDDHGNRVFITVGQTLFGSKSLSLYHDTLETPKAPHLVTEGVLRDVPIVPFFSVDVYGAFLDQLEQIAKAHNSQVVPFAYDWRQELSVSAGQLHALIAQLRARGVTKITIAAHSMGCLVAAYELGYGDQPLQTAELDWRGAKDVHNVVFMAGAFDGLFAIFVNMERGAKLVVNKTLLPDEAVASFPASYEILPFHDAHMLSFAGEKIAIDFADFTYWQKNHLGLLGNVKLSPDVRARRETFTQERLRDGVRFSKLIHFAGAKAPSSLHVLSLVGHGHATVATGFFDAQSGAFKFDRDSLSENHLNEKPLLADGDGTLLTASAAIPPAFAENAKLMTTTQEHAKVFADKDFMKELARFLP